MVYGKIICYGMSFGSAFAALHEAIHGDFLQTVCYGTNSGIFFAGARSMESSDYCSYMAGISSDLKSGLNKIYKTLSRTEKHLDEMNKKKRVD